MTQALTQGKPNSVNDPIDISSDASLSLPEILSLPSTPSTKSQIPTTTKQTRYSQRHTGIQHTSPYTRQLNN